MLPHLVLKEFYTTPVAASGPYLGLNNGRILPVAPPTLRVATVSLEPDLARKSARHRCGRHGRLGGRWALDGSTSVQ